VAPAPPGFVVPVSRYVQFMLDNHLAARAAAILGDRAIMSDRRRLDAALAELRRAIEEAPIDRRLVEAIRASIRRVAGNQPVRFRSSTNAEDLAGFSGAGLYTSKTVDLSDPRKSIERGLRAVWASVWNLRAVEERELFGIPHDQVAMAVLVHRAFPDERANGVAITRNLFTRFRPAFTVNVQAGEESVTNPEGDSTPEQFLYYTFYNEGPRVEVLSRSSETHGQPVLTDAQIEVLGRALAAIHDRFMEWYGSRPDYAMDVEFKFDGTGPGGPTLFIKQARPYLSGGCSL
jgi:phosphoenolpyruvate synthase/pyruvate phosphate dikinase